MNQVLNNPPYYDGRDLEKLAAKVKENTQKTNTVIVGPEIPPGTKLQLRYPHPLDNLNK